MNFKNVAVIFIVIILPIIMVFSLYAKLQIDTLNIQTALDSKLNTATYDTMQALNTNILNNVRNGSDSLARDINASINTFMSTLSIGFGSGGQDINYVKPYVPAITYILYDGYYIYSPTLNAGTGKYEHILKPYIYYTARYVNGGTDVIIHYTLDNYISYYGKFNNGSYETGAGYLEPLEYITVTPFPGTFKNIDISSVDSLTVKYNGIDMTDKNAKLYYINAGKFTETVKNKMGSLIKESDIKAIGDTGKTPVEFNRKKQFYI